MNLREPLPSAKLSAAVGRLQEGRRGSQWYMQEEDLQEEVCFPTVKTIKLSMDHNHNLKLY